VIVLNALLQPRLAAKDVVADLEATPIFSNAVRRMDLF
jgi:hypothetical protein